MGKKIIVIRKPAEALTSAAKFLHAPLAGDNISAALNNVSARKWSSPGATFGGTFASFYKVEGSDGVKRIVAHACVDLYGLDPAAQPWFLADPEKPKGAAYKRAVKDNWFLTIFDGDAADILEKTLESAEGDYDVYRDADYSRELLEIFCDSTGVVRNDFISV